MLSIDIRRFSVSPPPQVVQNLKRKAKELNYALVEIAEKLNQQLRKSKHLQASYLEGHCPILGDHHRIDILILTENISETSPMRGG